MTKGYDLFNIWIDLLFKGFLALKLISTDGSGSVTFSQVAMRSMAAIYPRAAIHKNPNRRLRLLLKYQYATRIMLFIAVSYASYSV